MPTYVVRLTHTSDQCPTANSKVRERVLSGASAMMPLAERLGIKTVTGPLVLGSEHETVIVVEAPSVEVVHDFVQQSGLIQWNTVRVSSAQPLEEAMQNLDKIPPTLY
jgi:hypothetical protein